MDGPEGLQKTISNLLKEEKQRMTRHIIYSRRGKNWPVAIKKADDVKEKTVWQENCLITRLYISAVHFLIFGCCPLPINHILQPPGPPRSLHNLLYRGKTEL